MRFPFTSVAAASLVACAADRATPPSSLVAATLAPTATTVVTPASSSLPAPSVPVCFEDGVVESALVDASGNVSICAPASKKCVVLTNPPALVDRPASANAATKQVSYVALKAIDKTTLPAFTTVGSRVVLSQKKDRWVDLPLATAASSSKSHAVHLLFVDADAKRALIWRAMGTAPYDRQLQTFVLADLASHKILNRSEGCAPFAPDDVAFQSKADDAGRVVVATFLSPDLAMTAVVVDVEHSHFAPYDDPGLVQPFKTCGGGDFSFGHGWLPVETYAGSSFSMNDITAIADDLRTWRLGRVLLDFQTGERLATLQGDDLSSVTGDAELVVSDTTHVVTMRMAADSSKAESECVLLMKLEAPSSSPSVLPQGKNDGEPKRCVPICPP